MFYTFGFREQEPNAMEFKMTKRMGGGRRQTGNNVSTLASNVLAGRVKPTARQIRSLAASALSQDETKGKR